MTARKTWIDGLVAACLGIAMAMAIVSVASAQEEKPKSRKEREAAAAAAEAEAPKADYSKEFRKLAGPVQTAVNEKKWAEVLAALPQLEALPTRRSTTRRRSPPGASRRPRASATRMPSPPPSSHSSPPGMRSPKTSAPCIASSPRTTARRRTLRRRSSTSRSSWTRLRTSQPDELETLGRLQLAGRPERGGLPDPRQGDRQRRRPRARSPRRCGSSCAIAASSS